MTTVRKWGVELADGWWFESRGVSVETLDIATLRTSPSDAAIDAGSVRPELNPTVREVLVTQEAGGIELGERLQRASSQREDCVVVFFAPNSACISGYLGYAYALRGSLKNAMTFACSTNAWAEATRFMIQRVNGIDGGYCEVWSIRRTEPREVRTAGRTLDEIKRPQPRGWEAYWSGPDGPEDCVLSLVPPLRGNADGYAQRPLYTRADVIAWARQVVEAQKKSHLSACDNGLYICETCDYNETVTQVVSALNKATREWEKSENG